MEDWAALSESVFDVVLHAQNAAPFSQDRNAERAAQAAALRDVVGSPFRAAAAGGRADPSWLAWDGGTVRSLAEAADEARTSPADGYGLEPVRLAVLSDALEEAGCTDGALLSHLRSPGPHVRGCWALELILGRS
jgi:hypothetical protein